MRYQVQVRANAWAGLLIGGRWVPAIQGTWNVSGQSPEEASTLRTAEEAARILDELVAEEAARRARDEETYGHSKNDAEFHVVEVD